MGLFKEMRIFAPFSTCSCVEMRQFQEVLRFHASGAAHELCWNRRMNGRLPVTEMLTRAGLRERFLFGDGR
jgi:hypothetical protein